MLLMGEITMALTMGEMQMASIETAYCTEIKNAFGQLTADMRGEVKEASVKFQSAMKSANTARVIALEVIRSSA